VQNETKISGLAKSFYDFGLFALPPNDDHLSCSAIFLKALQRLGFETNYVAAHTELISHSKIFLQENTNYNSGWQMASINNGQNLEYKSSPTAKVVILPGPFKAVGMGMDNKIWVVKTDRTIYCLDESESLVTVPGVADQISVGSANNVFITDDTTGYVYKNIDPSRRSGWSLVPGISFPRSICAVADGTLWFIDSNGRCLRQNGLNIELVHDGAGYDFARVNASGNKEVNFVALLGAAANGGRILLSQNNGPFFDLGIAMATDVAVGTYGSLICKFSNVVVPEHSTAGQPVWWRANEPNQLPLALDQTFSFSSTGNLLVKSAATLELARGANLRYQADATDNGINTPASKRHLILEDMSAQLKLVGATLTSTTTALALDYGRLSILGNCNIYSSAAATSAFELGSAVDLRIYPNSSLNLHGPMEVLQTDAPF
jgi:hypothetical protein